MTEDLLHRERKGRSGDREDLTFVAVVRVWWFHRIAIFFTTMVIALGGFSYLAFSERQYEAEALIKFTELPKRLVRVGQRTVFDPRNDPAIATSVVSMSSRSFLQLLAEGLDLFSDPEFAGASQSAPKLWEYSNLLRWFPWRTELSEEARGDSEQTSRTQVIDSLRERLIASQRGRSHVVSLKMTSQDADKAAKIVDAAIKIYLDDLLIRQQKSEASAMQWLEGNIEKLRGELAGLEGRILETAAENNLQGVDQAEFVSQSSSSQVVNLTTELASLKAEGAGLKAEYQEMRAQIASKGIELDLASVKSEALDGLRNAETALARRQTELRRELGHRHPAILALRNQINNTRQLMKRELHNIKDRLRNEVLINTARTEEMESQLSLLKDEFASQERATLDLIHMRQDLSTGLASLDTLISRRSLLEEKRALQKAVATVMSPASIPTKPTFPKYWPTLLFLLSGGFAFALVVVFLWDRWVSDFGFKNMEELRQVEMSPLGFIPELTRRDAKGMSIVDYVISHPNSAQSEAVQRIRSHLFQMRPAYREEGMVALVASSEPLEGKTTTAVILARQAAMSGSRTLLIDADVRNPNVHSVLGLDPRPGLCELLDQKEEGDLSFSNDPLTPLAILQAGTCLHNSTDLLRSKRMDRMLTELRWHYDWIFVDSPSLGAVVDGLILARHADTTLCLTRWLATDRVVAELNFEQIRNSGAKLAGVALSRVDMAAGRKYTDLDEIRYYGYYNRNEPTMIKQPSIDEALAS